MERHLSGQPSGFLVGGALTLADLVVAMHFSMLYIIAWDAEYQRAFPATSRFLAAIFTHPTTVKVCVRTLLSTTYSIIEIPFLGYTRPCILN